MHDDLSDGLKATRTEAEVGGRLFSVVLTDGAILSVAVGRFSFAILSVQVVDALYYLSK